MTGNKGGGLSSEANHCSQCTLLTIGTLLARYRKAGCHKELTRSGGLRQGLRSRGAIV